jgi:hypothetical protein
VAYSKLSIWNLALADLPAGVVASIDEESLEARECRRQYDHCVAVLLQRHDWGFGRTRVALAAVDNDRGAYWGYAYAAPANLAFPLQVTADLSGESGSYTPGVGQTLAATSSPYGPTLAPVAYEHERSIIYTNQPDAWLSFVANDVSEADFTPMFVDGLAKFLAARIAKAITKDEKRAQQLLQESEVFIERAIATNLNRQRLTYNAYPDVLAARDGLVQG